MISKARAYTNIALIKYWGKENEELIIPTAGSLSLTLDAFYTETKITSSKEDEFFLDGKKQTGKDKDKIFKFVALFRELARSDDKITIDSVNHVPTAAGLASSASGFAALAGALNEYFGLYLNDKELSKLTRRGSGSACRSIYGGFAEWVKGNSHDTSYAQPVEDKGFADELAMIFILVDQAQKKVSSRDGMKHTVSTSIFYDSWLENNVKDLESIKEAIINHDLVKTGSILENNALRMHATTLGANPAFTYWSPASLEAMDMVRGLRGKGYQAYFTMDAGPNVKILTKKDESEDIINELKKVYPSDKLILAESGPGLVSWKEE